MKDRALYLEIVKRLGKAENILDIGCGEGELCNYLAKHTGKRITGLDVSGAGFRKAKRMAHKIKVPNLIECVEGDVGNMVCFEGDEFDAVTMAYTLHHVNEEKKALFEIKRILKPGGRLIVADYVIKKEGQEKECHKFTIMSLEKLFQEAGFHLLESKLLEPDLALLVVKK
ncbi:MAG: class I SAM-dependent methyltransferase [Thermodesulfobacteriota bacterium]|nr:class I SAM-dependent methyltransferase [Thermodesulfobacteriota bacterium]